MRLQPRIADVITWWDIRCCFSVQRCWVFSSAYIRCILRLTDEPLGANELKPIDGKPHWCGGELVGNWYSVFIHIYVSFWNRPMTVFACYDSINFVLSFFSIVIIFTVSACVLHSRASLDSSFLLSRPLLASIYQNRLRFISPYS